MFVMQWEWELERGCVNQTQPNQTTASITFYCHLYVFPYQLPPSPPPHLSFSSSSFLEEPIQPRKLGKKVEVKGRWWSWWCDVTVAVSQNERTMTILFSLFFSSIRIHLHLHFHSNSNEWYVFSLEGTKKETEEGRRSGLVCILVRNLWEEESVLNWSCFVSSSSSSFVSDL